jgi:TRAP-type C4-dicarboxylate transport system permease small subunit
MANPSELVRQDPSALGWSWRSTYGRALEWLVFVLMIVLFVEVTLGIVFRALGQSLSWYDEVASILLAWLTFYGSALASLRRAHIGCPELVDSFQPDLRRSVAIVAQLFVVGFFGLLAYVGFEILPILATDFMTSLPDVPMSLVQSVIPISACLILISEIDELFRLVSGRPCQTLSGH